MKELRGELRSTCARKKKGIKACQVEREEDLSSVGVVARGSEKKGQFFFVRRRASGMWGGTKTNSEDLILFAGKRYADVRSGPLRRGEERESPELLKGEGEEKT